MAIQETLNARQADPKSASFRPFEGGACLGFERVVRYSRLDRLSDRQRIAIAVLLTWVPMAVLAAFEGLAVGSAQSEPFLLDPAMYARFLVALPLLLYSRKPISEKLQSIADHFLTAKLVKDVDRERFLSNVASTMRFRDSRVVAWMLLAFACACSVPLFWLFRSHFYIRWRVVGPAEHRTLSLAGWWFIVVSQTAFDFILLRFIYRIGLWWRFLWQTSRLDLQLDAAHPDGAGGLGFLGLTLRTFKEASFALSASLAGGLVNVVLETGTSVSSFRYGILAIVLANLGLFVGPLVFFHGMLRRTKDRGTLEYWALWQRQRRQFDQKWMRASPEYPDLLSVPDFSEATDLSQILERVEQVKLLPFRRKQVWPLVVAAILPFVLVATLEFPVDEILKQLVKMAL